MDKPAAVRLITQTFNAPFDETRFAVFARNLFNRIDESKAFAYQDTDAFKDHVRQYKRLGTYTDPEGTEIDILMVCLKKETALSYARTMQRNFVARYLKERGEKDAAIVAYYHEGQPDWRFSLVKMEYQLQQSEATGRLKVTEALTPARRFSFLVGQNEPNHTAQQQLTPILQDTHHNPTLAQLEAAFNIESVTKEFFQNYKDRFLDLQEDLDRLARNHKAVAAEFQRANLDTTNFTKKLLGQIVFLYFLQKKGWLGVVQGQPWGSGPKDFLRRLFEKQGVTYTNFFNDILEPLFYEALAIERPDHFYLRLNCQIPFLNGGLFEPVGNYRWREVDLLLPNDRFRDIFDTFDLYNFTVREDEPLDKEVAVDPEMLGKVFENLLEVQDRKSKGAFYTPREIVHYMCQESLINYLDTALNASPPAGGTEGGATIPRTDIDALIRHGELGMEHAATLDRALADIKICDPAIGSGAFPVGLMQEIVRARTVLNTHLKPSSGGQSRTLYALKRHAIQESIYGVDIDPGAVDIAKLRLWLSLVVDEDSYDHIQPLPNLDYKIVCGNSLIGFPKKWNSPAFTKLEELKKQYFSETDSKKKAILKTEVDSQIQERLAKSEQVFGYKVDFDFRLFFSEVFHYKGGFDVVIGNPPYVRANNMDKKQREYWQNSGEFETITGKFDIYILFIEKAIKLLEEQGILAFIVPYPVLSQNYAMLIRKYILQKCCIESIYDVSELKVFDAAVSTCVLILRREPSNNLKSSNIISARKSTIDFSQMVEWKIPQKVFETTFQNMYRLNAVVGTDIISERMWRVSKPFSDYCYIGIGIDAHDSKTGLDKSARIYEKPKGSHFKPYVEGKEIKRYSAPEWSRYLEYIPEKMHRPKYPEMFETEKILVQVVVGREGIIATLDKENLFAEQTLSVCVPKHILSPTGKKDTEATDEQIKLSKSHKLPYLFGLLCSKLINWYFQIWLSDELHVVPENLRQLPIRFIDFKTVEEKAVHDDIVKYVTQILAAKRANPAANVSDLEAEIDRLVYQLYGLTEEEIAIVEGRAS